MLQSQTIQIRQSELRASIRTLLDKSETTETLKRPSFRRCGKSRTRVK